MINFILLQAGGGGDYSMLFLLAGFAIIFYFFMIRPQQKKQKDQKLFLDNIKKGDQVVTIGGIHGRVSSIEGDTVILDVVEKGGKIKFEKSSISLDASKRFAGNTTK
jgi:preprotein translocase subunit YajC